MGSKEQARDPPNLVDKKKVLEIVGGCGSEVEGAVQSPGRVGGQNSDFWSYCCRMQTPATAAQKLDQLWSNTANLVGELVATNEMHISVNKTKRTKPSKHIKVTDLVKLIFGKKKIKGKKS